MRPAPALRDSPETPPNAPEERLRTPGRVAFAWSVHAFTASGAVLAAVALLATAAGEFARAGLLLLAALAIDSVDGTLARRAQVSRVVPHIDGRRLDDIVDYLNYALVPAVFLVATGCVSHWAWTILPILASAYGFAQHDAKTDDDFFLGFPSYWNVIALYLWLFDVTPWIGTAIVALFSALVLVPFKWVYPSHLRRLRRTTGVAGAIWMLVLAYCLIDPGRAHEARLVELSLAYPAWYLALSLWLGGFHRPGPRADR